MHPSNYSTSNIYDSKLTPNLSNTIVNNFPYLPPDIRTNIFDHIFEHDITLEIIKCIDATTPYRLLLHLFSMNRRSIHWKDNTFPYLKVLILNPQTYEKIANHVFFQYSEYALSDDKIIFEDEEISDVVRLFPEIRNNPSVIVERNITLGESNFILCCCGHVHDHRNNLGVIDGFFCFSKMILFTITFATILYVSMSHSFRAIVIYVPILSFLGMFILIYFFSCKLHRNFVHLINEDAHLEII